mmetsp:Transcript_38176/g.106331  ORF Transcript_38176/g.106331 Transcript_38176/m.106331 type:complete len:209 (+) Transcript_38176:34-660(+)
MIWELRGRKTGQRSACLDASSDKTCPAIAVKPYQACRRVLLRRQVLPALAPDLRRALLPFFCAGCSKLLRSLLLSMCELRPAPLPGAAKCPAGCVPHASTEDAQHLRGLPVLFREVGPRPCPGTSKPLPETLARSAVPGLGISGTQGLGSLPFSGGKPGPPLPYGHPADSLAPNGLIKTQTAGCITLQVTQVLPSTAATPGKAQVLRP